MKRRGYASGIPVNELQVNGALWWISHCIPLDDAQVMANLYFILSLMNILSLMPSLYFILSLMNTVSNENFKAMHFRWFAIN